MQELKDRIVKEGKVLPGNIIKVDGFLNHRIDTELMDHIAEEFGKHFNMDEVTMILTAEASGIALSAIVAHHFHKPMIFAKKAKSDNIEGGLYQSDIFSYTYKKKVTLLVSKEWLSADDKVLIIDDFMANGEAMRGLCDIVNAAGATLVGRRKGLPGRRRPSPGRGCEPEVPGHHRVRRARQHRLPGRGLILCIFRGTL